MCEIWEEINYKCKYIYFYPNLSYAFKVDKLDIIEIIFEYTIMTSVTNIPLDHYLF